MCCAWHSFIFIFSRLPPPAPALPLLTRARVRTHRSFTVFAGVRKQSDADALKAERPSLRPVLVDVVDEAQCKAAAAAVAADLAKDGLQLVGLVNNAGISWRLPLELEKMDEVRAMYEVNVFGLMQSSQAFIPLLRAAGAAAGMLNIKPRPFPCACNYN